MQSVLVGEDERLLLEVAMSILEQLSQRVLEVFSLPDAEEIRQRHCIPVQWRCWAW